MWISCVSSKRWFCSLWLTVLDHWFYHCSHVACHWLVMGRRPLALRGEFTFSQPMDFSKWKIHGEGSNSNKFDCSRVSLSWIHSWCSSQLKETAVWSRCCFFQGVPLLSFPISWHTGNALWLRKPVKMSMSFWALYLLLYKRTKNVLQNNSLEMSLWSHTGIWCKYASHNLFTGA